MRRSLILTPVLAAASFFAGYSLQGPPPHPVETPPQVVMPDVVEEKKEKKTVLACVGCNENEQITTNFLVSRGINDKKALATVLGNIRQESGFRSNICEGGARVPYDRCHKGGFGLIQWTTHARYDGLGNFAARYGGNPSTLETQLRYMVNEHQWNKIQGYLKTPGKSIEYYMDKAYTWLGWGIHGNRTYFAYDYLKKLKYIEL